MQVLTPKGLATYPNGSATTAGTLLQAGRVCTLASGLQVFSSSTCANSAPSVTGPANDHRLTGNHRTARQLQVANEPESTTNSVPAPPCLQQSPFTFNGQTSQFPHVAQAENGHKFSGRG